MVAIGGGAGGYGGNGGGGGALGYRNNVAVIPGTTYEVIVGKAGDHFHKAAGAEGGTSSVFDCAAHGGENAVYENGANRGGTFSSACDGGGAGGNGGTSGASGGGGAGGYDGNGGDGGNAGKDGSSGAGGGGGGAGGYGSNPNGESGGGGGGAGIYGMHYPNGNNVIQFGEPSGAGGRYADLALAFKKVMEAKAWGPGAMVAGGPHTATIRSRAGAPAMVAVARVAIMATAQHLVV